MIICKLWVFSFTEGTNKKLSAGEQLKQLEGRTQASSLLCKTQPYFSNFLFLAISALVYTLWLTYYGRIIHMVCALNIFHHFNELIHIVINSIFLILIPRS